MTDRELYGHDAVYVPVSVEMGLDAGRWPWLAPDRNPMPRLDLFPRLASLPRRVRRLLGLGRCIDSEDPDQ